MEWSAAVEKNREALKRILAMLVAMAEMGFGFPFFPQKGADVPRPWPAEKSKNSPALSLPRHLHRAILKLLFPAEAAVRRLIIAVAQGIVLPPMRPRNPKSKILRGARAFLPTGPKKRQRSAADAQNLPLLDPAWRWNTRAWRPAQTSVPRILAFDAFARFAPLPPPPSPDDPVDAARLSRRLEVLASALDDLPSQAKRFARWKARRDAALRKPDGKGRFPRLSPLRPGRPPGGRLSRYDPVATHPRNIREIDEILAHAHALAVYALERPDTS